MTASKVENCRLVVRPNSNDECLFFFPITEKETADAIVNLDGYLICPVEMFTAEEIDAATKKYFANIGA